MEMTKITDELLDQYILAGSAKASEAELRILSSHFCDKVRLRGHRSTLDEVARRRGQSRKSRNRVRRSNQSKHNKQAAS